MHEKLVKGWGWGMGGGGWNWGGGGGAKEGTHQLINVRNSRHILVASPDNESFLKIFRSSITRWRVNANRDAGAHALSSGVARLNNQKIVIKIRKLIFTTTRSTCWGDLLPHPLPNTHYSWREVNPAVFVREGRGWVSPRFATDPTPTPQPRSLLSTTHYPMLTPHSKLLFVNQLRGGGTLKWPRQIGRDTNKVIEYEDMELA